MKNLSLILEHHLYGKFVKIFAQGRYLVLSRKRLCRLRQTPLGVLAFRELDCLPGFAPVGVPNEINEFREILGWGFLEKF